jgi:hypothetical protein
MSRTQLHCGDTTTTPNIRFTELTMTEQLSGHSESETNEFLHKEYELCFEQLRFYDERQSNLLKFLFTLTSTVAAAQYALYKLFASPTNDFFLCLAILSLVVVTGSLLLFLSMIQNRLNFVFMARQINAIRGHLLRHEAPMFTENQLYTKTDFSAIKPFSVHTYQLVGAAFIVSLFAGSASFAIAKLAGSSSPLCPTAIVSVLFLIVTSIGGYQYLKTQGAKSADQAIHHEQKP